MPNWTRFTSTRLLIYRYDVFLMTAFSFRNSLSMKINMHYVNNPMQNMCLYIIDPVNGRSYRNVVYISFKIANVSSLRLKPSMAKYCYKQYTYTCRRLSLDEPMWANSWTGFTHPWTPVDHVTLSLGDITDKRTSWLVNVTFDWRQVMTTAV